MEESGRDDGDGDGEAERRDAEEADGGWRQGREFATSFPGIRGGIVSDKIRGRIETE